MYFADSIADFSAAQIVAALGCPRQTAYAWLDGSRTPPEWQQPHWLALIRAHQKKTAKPNKPAHTIPPRRGKKRGEG